MSQTLTHLTTAQQALARATTLSEILDIKDKAGAIRSYMKAAGESLVVQNQAAELKLRAERKAGALLAEMEKPVNQHGGNTMLPLLADLGITKMQSSRWQQEAKVADDVFEKFVAKTIESGEELTQSALLKVARGPHVGNNSGDNEWYTPERYIEPYRKLVGRIDLDPASCKEANAVVKAAKFFSIDDDGLRKQWKGAVWLNPPYGSGAVEPFCVKLLNELDSGRCTSAAMLVNNATETQWFQMSLAQCNAVCFLSSRIQFWKPEGKHNSPLQGQALLYFGCQPDEFCDAYRDLGCCSRWVQETF